jgi:peptide/nickel transport system substrate-binding protein
MGHSQRVSPAFDPDRARALLREAGYEDGAALGEIVLAGMDLWEGAISAVAAQLAQVGVRTRLLVATSDPELESAVEHDAHAFVWAWGGDAPTAGAGFLQGMLLWGSSLYRSEQLEELLAQAASSRDRDERLRTYREFERIWIGEQAAVLPLAYEDRLLWRRPWVTGMWANGVAMSTFADAVIESRPPVDEDRDSVSDGPGLDQP